MKRKNLTIVLVVAVALAFTLVPIKSFAAITTSGWYDAKIEYAGPLFDKIIIMVDAVDGTSFNNQWLELNPAMKNQLLATALSAQSMQAPVRIWVKYDPHSLVGINLLTCFSLLLVN